MFRNPSGSENAYKTSPLCASWLAFFHGAADVRAQHVARCPLPRQIVIRVQCAAVEDFKKTGGGADMKATATAKIPRTSQPRHDRVCGTLWSIPSAPRTTASAPRGNDGAAVPFKGPCKFVAGAFPQSGGESRAGRKSAKHCKKLSKSCLTWGRRRREFPN